MKIKTRIVHQRSRIIENPETDETPTLDKSPFLAVKKESQPQAAIINTPKPKGRKIMRFINVVFSLLVLLILMANSLIVYQYTVKGYSPTQTFSGLAHNSIKVVDAVWKPELKSTDGYTAGLIMGIDSRQLDFDGKKFNGKDRDIDTIMQVVVKHDTGDIFIFSIPRDTGITITEECAGQSRQYFKSINHAYKLAEDGKCPGGGIGILKKYVTSITGFENHYYAIISYNAFRDIVNAVGESKDGKKGLYIDVPRNIYEYYPREDGGGFEAVYFPQGRQFIDSTQLLKYARSRKASSDFDRAKRQQQVIEGIQNRILKSSTLSDPIKIYNLYRSFQKNALFSPVSIDDIRGGVALLDKISPEKTHKFVLDDTLGGLNALITRPSYSGYGTHNRAGYYLSPVAFNDQQCLAKKDEYCKVKEYLKNVYNKPESFSEQASIYAYSNVPGKAVTNTEFETGKAKVLIPINTSKYALAARTGWGNVQIFDFSNGAKPKTKAMLEKAFGVTVHSGSEAAFKTNINHEDFAIVVKVN